jgi:response regulator RpfG family c-di-GMP phosphodiesterase
MADTELGGNGRGETAPSATPAPFSLLLVDDEPNILNSLKRLLHGRGYRVQTAPGGAEGLAIMARETVDLVISDMRMPEMTGAEFLSTVRIAWPGTVRVLLTGYADMASTIEAINQGEIFRYVTKPWDEARLLAVIEEGLERKALEREKRRLELLTREQNIELAELNRTLEEKVEQRTTELKEAHAKLRTGFFNTVRVFSSVVEMRDGTMAGHSRRVAELVRAMTRRLEVPPDAAQDMLFAALLHDIGKIGFADRILTRPWPQLTVEERNDYVKHPAKGAALLMAMEPLQVAARIIRMHHERLDGSGYPDHLHADEIWQGARILAVADDYDEMIHGGLLEKPCSAAAARELIVLGRGRRYDAQVVDAFLEQLEPVATGPKPLERELGTDLLEPGMVLARDFMSREGMLLLAREHVLDSKLIRQIRGYERSEGGRIAVCVRT